MDEVEAVDGALEASDGALDDEMDEMDKMDEEDAVAARVLSHGRAGRRDIDYGDDDDDLGTL